jgi:DNA-binding XRE family transcriptional regulator
VRPVLNRTTVIILERDNIETVASLSFVINPVLRKTIPKIYAGTKKSNEEVYCMVP